MIILVYYGAHLHWYSSSVYQSQIRSLVDALRLLLDAKPEATVIVKGNAPAVNYVGIHLLFNKILFKDFSTLKNKVVYLDAYSIFVANNNMELHPNGTSLQNLAYQFLSYVC